jgi:hypothetical protein
VKNVVAVMTAALSLMLAGCDDQARKLADETKGLLKQRSEQLAAKIAAERAAYRKSAAHDTESRRALADSALRNERNERTDSLAADYDEGRKPVSLWRKDIGEYARIDYTRNRELLLAEMDSETLYIKKFEDLKAEKDKVDALAKLLDALANRRTIKEDVDALNGFAADTAKGFDVKICTELQNRKKGTGSDATAAADAYGSMQCDSILKAK